MFMMNNTLFIHWFLHYQKWLSLMAQPSHSVHKVIHTKTNPQFVVTGSLTTLCSQK